MVVGLGVGIEAPGKDEVYRTKASLQRVRSGGEKPDPGQQGLTVGSPRGSVGIHPSPAGGSPRPCNILLLSPTCFGTLGIVLLLLWL